MINLDMDCVIANYRDYAIHVAGHDPANYPVVGWEMNEVFPDAKTRWAIISGYGRRKFFADLPLYPWSKRLVSDAMSLGDIRFLTGIGRTEDRKGKEEWLRQHFPDVAHRLVTVNPNQCKSDWLEPGDVLVDDLEKSVLPWIEKGGQAIWFPGVETEAARRHANWYVMEGSFKEDLKQKLAAAKALGPVTYQLTRG